jgi:signal transduction histidine kinase
VNWKALTAPEFSSRASAAVAELRATGVFTPFEEEYLRKGGERVPVLVGGAAMSQSPLEWMCFVLDQTEQKRLEELNNRERDQRQLLGHEIRAREEERRLIARELHDETGQMMASLLAGLRAIADAKSLTTAKSQANELRKIAASAIDELGRVSRGLHPFALDDHGLAIALRNYTEEYSKVHGLRVSMHFKGLETRRLSSPLEIALYRISQEALTNISKHAEAKSVEITLDVGDKFLNFQISDDGRGFNVKKLQADYSGKHLGLRSMRERAVLLGGEFMIQSRDGGGTVKTFRIPVAFACDTN